MIRSTITAPGTWALQVCTLSEAVQDCKRVVATTHKCTSATPDLQGPSEALPWLVGDPGAPAALIFGAENRGLTNVELSTAQRFLCVPSSPAYPVLNLAQAVAVCCYDMFRVAGAAAECGDQVHTSVHSRRATAVPVPPRALLKGRLRWCLLLRRAPTAGR